LAAERTIDHLVAGRAARDGLGEGVEVDDDEVDRADAMLGHGRDMVRIVADGEQAAMHFGVERLDAAVHHLGKAGQVRNVAHLEARLAQRFGGAAGRDQFDAVPGQRLAEFGEPGLVGDGEERAFDGDVGHGGSGKSWSAAP
jgi:hypothetical protein